MPRISSVLTALVATLIAGSASAMIFPLFTYENSHGTNVTGLDLWFDVTDGGSYVDFTFYNSSAIASNVANIYFEASGVGLALGSSAIQAESAGVDFNAGGNPANPAPGQIPLNWAGTEARYRARNPAPTWGIHNTPANIPDEWLRIRFSIGQATYGDVLADLSSGNFRVAQHVTGMPESIWTVSGKPTDPVPLPASVWLLGSGLVGWIGVRRVRGAR